MAKSLKLDVVTPDRTLLSTEIASLIVPAVEGYLGVLPNHAPMILGLLPGAVKYRSDGKLNFLSISGGFMEIGPDRVTLLADCAEKANEIDRERAQAAKGRAAQRLKERPSGLDVQRAELALKRALARLQVTDYSK
ncbi:MAG: ATP synthase F1 subunit epsilon [Firmicutes bacterium HGW-Firmicutes-12]|jgi:F-type H+-transporting ATPase subunit epsilon|nr:MAG: ATP synthase F1 subunit epsilon [Firmicutes bacterium HGW-Firmicutes-12]